MTLQSFFVLWNQQFSFINKLRGDEARASEETSLGEQRSMLEEQTQPDEEMLESSGVDIDNGKKDMGVMNGGTYQIIHMAFIDDEQSIW